MCGAAIEWSSKHQLFVTLSSTEAEYIVAVEAGKEIKWMRNILIEFEYPPSYTLTLFIDNKSGIDISKNPEHHGWIKHLGLWLYWLRDAVQESLISPVYVPTQQNITELFTKAVQPQVIEFAISKLGLRS